MNIPDDLKDYKAPLGAFQLIDPDLAIFLLICGGFIGYVFRDML